MARSTPSDDERLYKLYYFLCACLAMKQKPDGSPNSSAIGDRFSDKADVRKFVSRLLNHDPSLDLPLDLGGFSKLTTGSLVEMLICLNQSLQKDYVDHQEPFHRLLSPTDILAALTKFVELTPEERQKLGLAEAGDGLTLLQRALLILQTLGGTQNYEMIFRVYKAAVGLDFPTAEPSLPDLEAVDHLIETTVAAALAYLPERTARRQNGEPEAPSRQDTVQNLTLKAQREVRRLLARSGNQESSTTGQREVDAYIQHYFQPGFVVKLAQTVVINERLTSDFPIYLKRITIEATGPLPFADKAFETIATDSPYGILLHPGLRELAQASMQERSNQRPGPGDYELASQEANRVTAEFYVKVPEGYAPAVRHVFEQIASGDGRRIDFALSSTGIGGALSHVIKVINRALLGDIDCLRDYFTIAHDVTSTQAIIRDNVASPIWAHSLVKLCRKETVGLALQQSTPDRLQPYEELSFADPIGHGDYCGFDFLSAQAQAALQARLQAIRTAGVLPNKYLTDFCRQTEYLLVLKNAWGYVRGYPFSTLAMIGTIEQDILAGMHGEPGQDAGEPGEAEHPAGLSGNGTGGGDRPLTKADPSVYSDACLSIAEALLDEGVYRRAYHYLQRLDMLDEFVQRELANTDLDRAAHPGRIEIFSGALLVRYLLCWANYYYLYDPRDDREAEYLPPESDRNINREGLVRRAWETLGKAEKHIERRLRKYVAINEVSQGTFHPHYELLGRIAYLRAKLLLFFSRHVPYARRYLATDLLAGQQRSAASIHWGRLFLAEKARLYAAADGNGEQYACYAAMQSWLYLITAFASPDYHRLTVPNHRKTFSFGNRSDLLRWARLLRDHALISYADTGRQCYYQIKEKSGLPGEHDDYGCYRVKKIKPIYEARRQDQDLLKDASFLVLDMSLLAIQAESIPKISPYHPDRNIYLFGSNACYLFFARGLYFLCSNEAEEFGSEAIATSLAQWDAKLEGAMRLLNMAWAIAEEGGGIDRVSDHPAIQYEITRALEGVDREQGGYTSPDVESIRDLYPRRINEIADLGKVFAAVCMVLRLHTAPAELHPQLRADSDRILASLHGAYRFNDELRQLFDQQERYNGHLEPYFERVCKRLHDHRAAAPNPSSSVPILQHRDALLTALFSQLLD